MQDQTIPMSQWSSARAAAWVAKTLSLEEDVATALHEEFEAGDIEGDGLVGKMKRVQRVIAQLTEGDPDEAITKLRDARERFMQTEVPQARTVVVEWDSVLSASLPERQLAMQGVLNHWHRGRWVLSGQLGEGGSGVVFRAKDSRLGSVAIKFTA
jgi:hypothetical protein